MAAAALLVAAELVLEAGMILVFVKEEAVFAVILLLVVVAVEFVATEVDVVLVATSGWGADLTARSSRSCR